MGGLQFPDKDIGTEGLLFVAGLAVSVHQKLY